MKNPLAVKLKGLSAEVDTLEQRVYSKLNMLPEDSKRVPFYFSVPVTFQQSEMALREGAYVNGAQDVSLIGMTYYVTAVGPQVTTAGTAATGTVNLLGPTSAPRNSGIPLQVNDATGENTISFLFDFKWNFRTKQGTTYLGAGAIGNGDGNMLLAPRTALGFYEKGDWLQFNRPQVLKAGESLYFSVKPSLWAASGRYVQFGTWMNDETDFRDARVTVHMTGLGFRDGRMAWPTIRK